MESSRNTGLVIGLLLLLIGGWLLAIQIFPGLGDWINIDLSWPWLVIGAGGVLLLFGLLFRTPEMAVPAMIVSGIGGILLYQNSTGNWGSWSYVWTLIPGFVGLGSILAGLLGGRPRRSLRDGFVLVIISLVLFAIFGSFLGGLTLLGQYWPVLLILLGLWLLVQTMLRMRRTGDL